jgi:hypothetical protein
MTKQVENGWKCSVCGKLYEYGKDKWPQHAAKECEKNHDLVYVAFFPGDLRNLVQFLYTKDDTLLTESLVKTLTSYKKRMGSDHDVFDL